MNVETILRPTVGTIHGLPHLGLGCAVGDALVKAHGNVRGESFLVGHGQFGGEIMLATVDVGPELDPIIADLAQRPHAEGLKTTAVGEYRSVPAHELVETA